MKPVALAAFLFLVVASVLAIVFHDRLATLDQMDVTRLVYLLLAGLWVGAGMFAMRGRTSVSQWIGHALVWVALIAAVAFAFLAFGQDYMAARLSRP